MTLVPAPGGTAGDLTPRAISARTSTATMFGRHLWVQSKTWDPEGLLSTIPAIGDDAAGVRDRAVAGNEPHREAKGDRHGRRPAWSRWRSDSSGDSAFPINKNLWTSSYVWFTGGAALVTLALCYAISTCAGGGGWRRPLVVLGLNAITLFVLSGMIAKALGYIKVTGAAGKLISLQRYIYTSLFVPIADPYNASLLYALANLVVLWAILFWMDRKGLYLKA